MYIFENTYKIIYGKKAYQFCSDGVLMRLYIYIFHTHIETRKHNHDQGAFGGNLPTDLQMTPSASCASTSALSSLCRFLLR